MPLTLAQVKVPAEFLARIDLAAEEKRLTRSEWIRRACEAALETETPAAPVWRKGGKPAERHPVDISPPVTITPTVDPVLAAARRATGPVTTPARIVGGIPCLHPKDKRVSLGYAVKCGECGEVMP